LSPLANNFVSTDLVTENSLLKIEKYLQSGIRHKLLFH